VCVLASGENGVVYFGSYDGNFYAVDAATGQVKWKFATRGKRRFAAKHLHAPLPRVKPCPILDFYMSFALVSGARLFRQRDATSTLWDAASGTVSWNFRLVTWFKPRRRCRRHIICRKLGQLFYAAGRGHRKRKVEIQDRRRSRDLQPGWHSIFRGR